jgi:hypothetical protein
MLVAYTTCIFSIFIRKQTAFDLPNSNETALFTGVSSQTFQNNLYCIFSSSFNNI